MSVPPPGGYSHPPPGGAPPPQWQGGPPQAPQWQGAPPPQVPPKKGLSGCVIALIVGLILLVVGGGIMAVLAIYGTRKYIQQAKAAEARNTLGVISRAARMTYEEEQPDGRHRLCPSASQPVPASASMIRGKKYMSAPSDWTRDRARNAGFACLKVDLAMPQYFQYEYEATATTFVARAHGDLDGDGVTSTFEIRGEVVGGAVVVSPNVREVDPAE